MTFYGLRLLFWLLPQLPDLTGDAKEKYRPASSTSSRYIELLERNTHIVYPVLGAVVLLLIGVGITQAWRERDMDGAQKAELKREIVIHLRKQLGGADAETLSRSIGLASLKLLRLLEEMQKDGIVTSYVNTQRLTVWRLKGVGVTSR